jgi:hypothetical protein
MILDTPAIAGSKVQELPPVTGAQGAVKVGVSRLLTREKWEVESGRAG